MQFKAGEDPDAGLELGRDVQRMHQQNQQLKISNLGLVMIILSKNVTVLSHLLKEYPTIFMNAEKFEDDDRTHHSDLLDGALLCILKQWAVGLNLLLDQVAIHFSKASFVDRLAYVLKLFAILKHYRNKQTQKCCELILALPKVRVFIYWLSKPENQQFQEQLIYSYCLRMFPEESADKICSVDFRNSSPNGGDDLLKEFQQLTKIQTDDFSHGVYNNQF